MNFDNFSKEDSEFLFQNFTFSANFYNFLVEMIPRLKIETQNLEKHTNFKISKVPKNKRVSIIQTYKLCEEMEKISGHTDLGLQMADFFTIPKSGPIGQLFIHTSNLRKSVEVMKIYTSLIVNNINIKYLEVDNTAILYFDIVPRFVTPLSVSECYFKICHNWMKQYTGLKCLPIKEINFYCKKPIHAAYYKKNFPNTKVYFGKSANCIIFDKKLFYIKNFRKKYPHYKLILNSAKKLKRKTFLQLTCKQKIVNEIIKNMPQGTNHIDIIAKNLDISVSTLKRHLKDEHTTFSNLTDHIRKILSYYLVKDKNISYEEISKLLGYSEYSPFFRAFKKWYYISPSHFRNS